MQQSYLSIPSSTAILAGTVAGWGMYRLQLRNRILLLIVFSLTVYFAADPVYDKLLFRMNFGPNGGKANEPIPASALLTTDSTAVQFGDKIVLLDFWNTTCGVCYRTFPQVQEVWKRYANHPKVAVYSVNIPVRNEQFSSQLRRLSQYDFPQLLAIRNEQAKEYGVVAYPTVLVVHNQHILYRGDLEQGVELVESILATP
jgi:thiol-disulfide isomerase/thioredoxin